MQDRSDGGVLIWLAPWHSALIVLCERTHISKDIRKCKCLAYIMRINVGQVVKQPIDLLRTCGRVELIEGKNVCIRSLLNSTTEGAYMLIGLLNWLVSVRSHRRACIMAVGARVNAASIRRHVTRPGKLRSSTALMSAFTTLLVLPKALGNAWSKAIAALRRGNVFRIIARMRGS